MCRCFLQFPNDATARAIGDIDPLLSRVVELHRVCEGLGDKARAIVRALSDEGCNSFDVLAVTRISKGTIEDDLTDLVDADEVDVLEGRPRRYRFKV